MCCVGRDPTTVSEFSSVEVATDCSSMQDICGSLVRSQQLGKLFTQYVNIT